jgi:hypothetical protein
MTSRAWALQRERAHGKEANLARLSRPKLLDVLAQGPHPVPGGVQVRAMQHQGLFRDGLNRHA